MQLEISSDSLKEYYDIITWQTKLTLMLTLMEMCNKMCGVQVQAVLLLFFAKCLKPHSIKKDLTFKMIRKCFKRSAALVGTVCCLGDL